MFESPSNSTDMLLNILLNIKDCQKIIALAYQLAYQTKVLQTTEIFNIFLL